MKQFIIAILILIIMAPLCTSAQKTGSYIEITTWKYSDDTRKLFAKINIDDKELLENLSIHFFNKVNESEILIGSASTNPEGLAELVIPANFVSIYNDEYYTSYIARFEGNEKVETSEEVLEVKNANIDFEFVLIDSIKHIKFKGTITGNKGEELPLADDDLYFFVPRMFSSLKIAEGWFEEDGTGVIEFPKNIIGDSLGMVSVIAKIEEHFDYGNIEKRKIANWAVPFHPSQLEGPSRELWTPIAPMWMIITLIIMLTGVWGHYIYAIYELYKIKKLGSKNKIE
jgi:hypothetical protein